MGITKDPCGEAGLSLRRAGFEDAELVRAFTRAAYAQWVPVIGREPKPMGADYARAVREHRIDLAYAGGALAGLVELVAEPDAVLIENLAVSADHRGRGIGRALVRHAESVAEAGGLPRLRLYTNRLMTANVALYLRLGFTVDREERNAFGTVVHMSKPVSAP